MKTKLISYILLLILTVSAISCAEEKLAPAGALDCQTSAFPPNTHPKASEFQALIDKYGAEGIAGQSLMVDGPPGFWLGTSGKADIASDTDMQSCHKLIIASCTKTFTASIIFLLVEEGRLNLTDKLSDYLPNELLEDVANAKEAEIQDILSHRSGIPDFYTPEFELDRLNTFHNNFSQEDMLSYTRGRKAETTIGGEYSYSNTNYLLLGMLLEEVLGKPLAQIYEERLFTPLGLDNSDFVSEVPDDLVSGYFPYNGNALYEAERLYGDELGSADGGIVSTAYDIGRFMKMLAEGQVVNSQSLQKMTDWFDIPEEGDEDDETRFTKNGFGLEYYETPEGITYGHTGAVDGFYTLMFYFPEQQTTFIYQINGGTNFDAWLDAVDELRKALFS
ncbi:MAG: serine hydrolase domain-containing protein [Bacteroidota bacterium]